MANYYTQLRFKVDIPDTSNRDWLLDELNRSQALDLDDHIGIEYTKEQDGIWFWSEESARGIEKLANILSAFLKRFYPHKCITFCWGDTCSKPRLDGFGGGAVFVTADKIKWMNTYTWQDEQVKKFTGKKLKRKK